jgi:putative N6-adenine-specific DNA methylase
LFVSTSPGLEPALTDELREWAPVVSGVRGGAEVMGPPGLHRALNLHLRTATRVLIRIASFEARDLRALEAGLARVSLAPFRGAEPLRIEAITHRSRLSHGGRVREAAALAWQVPLATATPEGIDEDDEPRHQEARVQIRLEEDRCTVSVDSSGDILHRRGYRQEVSRAPLRETLAAGILRLATYRGDEPLWDPMCGSGTLAIEAAWIALGRAPGRDRSFAFQRWPGYEAGAFEEALAAARAKERTALAYAIHASDINAGALGTARRNARRAGVLEHLQLRRADVMHPSSLPPDPTGLLVTNPPYGKRSGDAAGVEPLCAAIGALLRERLPGWRAAVVVPDLRLERALSLQVEDAFELLNGGIRCHLLVTRPHAST